MAQTNGQLNTCDRCGATVFLACTGEKEADGGYTRWNTFEPFPEGWEYHHEVGRLCPKCNRLWNELVDNFKKHVETVIKIPSSVTQIPSSAFEGL